MFVSLPPAKIVTWVLSAGTNGLPVQRNCRGRSIYPADVARQIFNGATQYRARNAQVSDVVTVKSCGDQVASQNLDISGPVRDTP